MLWSFKGRIDQCQISSDGNYIFLIPEADEEHNPFDNFYFLNKEGKEIWEISPGKYRTTYWMANDADRIIIADTLYDRNGKILWKLPPNNFFVRISKNGSYATVHYIPPYDVQEVWSGYIKISCADLNQKRILWEKNAKEISPYYFIDELKEYLVTLIGKRLWEEEKMKEGEMKIYDLKTGKLIKKTLNPTDFFKYEKTYLNRGKKYIAEKEGNSLNYYTLGATK